MTSNGRRARQVSGMRAMVQRRPMTTFLVIVYAITVASAIPEIAVSRGTMSDGNAVLGVLGVLAALGPALAAVIVSGVGWGRERVDVLLQGLFRGGRRLSWYGLALAAQALLSGVALLLTLTVDGQADGVAIEWMAVPIVLVGVLFMLTLWEELGFRGFAQGELQQRVNPLVASLLVGVAWAVWHVPQLFIEGSPSAEVPPALFLLDLVTVSVVYAWLFNRTSQSVLFVSVFHAAGNALAIVALEGGVNMGVFQAFQLPLGMVAAVALAIITRTRLEAP